MGSLEHAETELLNLLTFEWKRSTPYLNYKEIFLFAAIFHGEKFYVVGGKTKDQVLSDVATFDPKKEKWSRVGRLKFPRFDHKVDVIDDKIFMIGGSAFPEYCDLTNFACSMFTDAIFKNESSPTLYAFYPSNCKLGILIFAYTMYSAVVSFGS